MLNIFEDDAFSVAALTDSINLQPYVPQRIGEMGLFEEKNPRAPVVFLERKGDLISLIPTKPRGSGETTKRATSRRDIRPIAIPYVPYDDDVLASEVSGVRAFGTEEDLETVAQVVDEKMAGMRQDHEVTHEYMRLGAIKGVILDADEAQTPLLDLFDAFNITQHEVTLDLSLDDSALVKQEVIDIIRYMEDVLGAGSYDHIHAFVGNAAYDRMTTYPEVADAKAEGSNYEWLLKTQGQGTKGRGTSQFAAFDVVGVNYRG